MTVTEVAAERRAIVESLREVGPLAPTLAGRWSASELAQHLAVQDRLWGIPALVARSFVATTNVRLTAAYLDRPRVAALVNAGSLDWDQSLRRLEAPPPRAVLRPPAATLTIWEHFVHHEDVRRPAGHGPRAALELAGVVEWLLRYNARQLRSDALRLEAPDGRTWSSGAEADLVVRGPVSELVLWLSGRAHVAEVTVDGDADRALAVARALAI